MKKPEPPRLDSRNSPLRIASLRLGNGPAMVGFTLCPGKWQDGALSGSWRRDLRADVEHIHTWGAAAVVTLMTWDELRVVRADDVGSTCEQMGIEWYHLPIRDLGVPDDGFEAGWTYAGVRLREHLRHGRSVLVHCLGGLGRSGMIAARLLVELGLDPDRAILAARAERPGAIETKAQVDHVRRVTPIAPASDAHAARILGCILGGAVGDAFGYAVEFDRLPEIRRKHGSGGLQHPVLQDGKLVVSDDTQMTLFTLEAMNLAQAANQGEAVPDRQALLLAEFREACLRWGDTQGATVPPYRAGASRARLLQSRAMRQRRAPGMTCLAAVRAGATSTMDRPINDSKGCGAVMRTAPIGLLPDAPFELSMTLGCQAGAMTHGHADGWLPAGTVAAMTRLLAQGLDIDAAASDALQLLAHMPGANAAATPVLLQRALELARQAAKPAAAYAALGEGWTGDEALAIAVYCSLAGSGFVEAIRLAANHDGDSDSTASIAGQLRGTVDGITAVPHAWVQRLDVLPEALALIHEFITLGVPPVQWQDTPASKASRIERRNDK